MTGNFINKKAYDKSYIITYKRVQGDGERKALAIGRSKEDVSGKLRRMFPKSQITELIETEHTPIIGMKTIDAILQSQAYSYLNAMTGKQVMNVPPREDKPTQTNDVPPKKLERVLG